MITYFNLRKGVQFIMDGQPCEIMDFRQMGKAQDVVVAKTKVKNLITGKIVDRNFHQQDTFEEADLQKMEVKFVYSHRGKLVFCESANPGNRFELTPEQIGDSAKFMKPNQLLEAIIFQEKIITVSLPIKINLKVTEAPPGVKGDRAQGGTKSVTLETGVDINVPLFVEQGDIVEVNTETGEYVRRVE